MKTIEPQGVTESGAISVRATYHEGETLTASDIVERIRKAHKLVLVVHGKVSYFEIPIVEEVLAQVSAEQAATIARLAAERDAYRTALQNLVDCCVNLNVDTTRQLATVRALVEAVEAARSLLAETEPQP